MQKAKSIRYCIFFLYISLKITFSQTITMRSILVSFKENLHYIFLYCYRTLPRYDYVTLIPLVIQLGLRIGPIQRMGAN
jgi:hypothetical protein